MKKPIQRRTVTQEVKDKLAAGRDSTECDATPPDATPPVSFATDIRPIFMQFRGQMAWRLDLTDYQAVLGNAELIHGYISSETAPMPPPPFAPLTGAQIEMFAQWMAQGCPP